jgi:hypothetical protein
MGRGATPPAAETPDAFVAGTLRALGTAPVRVDIDAGFFHRTLARWLGLPEGRAPGTIDELGPIVWDYGLWKAELVRDDEADEDAGDGRRRERWSAILHRVADAAPERVAWTVDKDARGAIVASAWRTAAPRLIDDEEGDGVPAPLPGAVIARLVDDAGT